MICSVGFVMVIAAMCRGENRCAGMGNLITDFILLYMGYAVVVLWELTLVGGAGVVAFGVDVPGAISAAPDPRSANRWQDRLVECPLFQ